MYTQDMLILFLLVLLLSWLTPELLEHQYGYRVICHLKAGKFN